MPVDAKVHNYYKSTLPWVQNYAFMHWDMAADIKRFNLYSDGKPFDTAKLNSHLSLWHQKKFIWTVKGMNMAALSPEHQMKKYMSSLTPWLGLSLSYLGYLMAYYNGLTTATPVAAVAAGKPPAAGQEVLLAKPTESRR